MPQSEKETMVTPVTKRPIPDGYTLDYNPDIWNVGHVFRWAEFFGQYAKDTQLVSIAPNEKLAVAYERAFGEPQPTNVEIFFSEK